MTRPHRTKLRRLGWLALVATGVALYVASLSGMASVRGDLAAATSQSSPAQGVPVAYRDARPTGRRGDGEGCRDRGERGHAFGSTRDF